MATYQTQIPGAAGYAGAAALAQKAYANALARINQQRGQTMLKYGVHRGAGGQIEADADNEYGQYQQMLRNEDRSVEGLERAQAASGWGAGSGYLGRQADDLAHAQGAEQVDFGRGLQSSLDEFSSAENQAAYDRDAALWQAQQAAEEESEGGRGRRPGDYTGISAAVDYGAAPGAKVAPPKPKPKLRTAKPSGHAAARRRLVERKAAVRAAAKKKKGRRR